MVERRLVTAGLLGWAASAHAGLLDDLKDAARNIGSRAAEEAEAGLKKGKEAVGGKKNEPAAPTGRVEPQAGQTRPAADGAGGPAAAGSGGLDEAVYSRYDFVPGEKLIFFDDFSDTDVGEFPLRWHLKGPRSGDNNTVEVVAFQGRRYLRSRPAGAGGSQAPSTQYARLNIKGDLPQKFTIEFDAALGHSITPDYPNHYSLYLLASDEDWPGVDGVRPGVLQFSGVQGRSANTQTSLSVMDGKLHHIAVSVNGSFVKAWVDQERVVNDPDGIERPIRLVGLVLGAGGYSPSDRVMFTNFRLAEGGKDIKAALETEGRIVTHGILFDTGSDRLRNESLPTLKMILALLQQEPKLRFSIEGHTDDQGGKGVNQPLSERRAAAVQGWLAGKGIEAARLAAKGFGDSKPIDRSNTPEGRANNRRVEFVRF